MPKIVDRKARRAAIVDAATRVFAKRGVADTAVAHIVEEAGVAQGTFYLYFESREDVVVAVAERLVDYLSDDVEAAVAAASTGSAAERLLTLTASLGDAAADPDGADLLEFLHRPENRAVHDRMAERLLPRLAVLCESIIESGVDAGEFSVPDTRMAAWFILGGLRGAELSGASHADMPASFRGLSVLALRVLGFKEPVE